MSDEEFDELILELGDEVTFECGDLDDSQPRWSFNDDLGSSGIWAHGTVTHVDERIIQVEYWIEGFVGKGQCTWPNYEHEDYDPMQWYQDGYLSLVKRRLSCECGAETVYGPQTSHTYWCPKYKQ